MNTVSFKNKILFVLFLLLMGLYFLIWPVASNKNIKAAANYQTKTYKKAGLAAKVIKHEKQLKKSFAPEDELIPSITGLQYKIVDSYWQEEKPALDQKTKITLIKTQLKFPLLRVVDRWEDETVVDRKIMAADHFMIKVKPGTSASELSQWLEKLPIYVSKINPDTGYASISIEESALNEFDSIMLEVKSKPVVQYAEPDWLVQSI